MAGALFENFCVQETIKLYMNNGLRPQLYYLRTNNNLEVDLIIEEAYQQLTPIEIKLSKTPSPAMGAHLARFKKTFPGLSTKKGLILSLVDTSAPLNKEITAISFDDYLAAVSKMIAL